MSEIYMNAPVYGMFTNKGNAEVEQIVTFALVNKSSWTLVESMLVDLSRVEGFEEALDTEVRELVYSALGFGR
jgi:hypothetical protein